MSIFSKKLIYNGILILITFFIISVNGQEALINSTTMSYDLLVENNSTGDGISNRWAVLIGCSEYDNNGLMEKIDINTINYMKNILIYNGWKEDYIYILISEQATTEAIMNDSFNWLIDGGEDTDDVILFLFCGHGFYLDEDLEPFDEVDGTDEIIHPWDTEWGGWYPNTYIVDDDLSEKFKALKSKSKLIIIDTCHSGVMIDGACDLYCSGQVVITASRNHELSYSLPLPMMHLLTYYLCKAFNSNDDKNNDGCISAEEAFLIIEQPVKIRSLIFTLLYPFATPMIQHPQIFDGWPSEEDNSEELILIEL